MRNNLKFPGMNVHLTRIMQVMMLVAVLLISSCQSFETAIDKGVKVIDDGIHDILQHSDTWQSILQRVANDLPLEISQTVRVDAQSLATRSIATAGIEFRCNVDFLSNRAVQSLSHLKDELLNTSTPTLPPDICQIDPPSVDLKISPAKWSTIMISGYDFDHKDDAGRPLRVSLQNKNGDMMPLPENRIVRNTHYQITLNLGDMASQLYHDQIVKIVMSWSGKSEGNSQIGIIPWERKTKSVQLSIGTTGSFQPPHVAGDADFSTDTGAPTILEIHGEVRMTEQVLYNRMYMHAREVAPDNTEVAGWSPWAPAYSAPMGWRIIEVRPNAPSNYTVAITSNQTDSTPIVASRPAGEVVDRFEVWVDRDGDEAGSYSRMITHWRPLEIKIEQVVPEWLR